MYKYSDGRVYEGNYRRDEANDKAGRMTWPNGTIFIGDFIRGNRTGGGKIVYPSSRVTYEGEFGKYALFRVKKKGVWICRDDSITIPCHSSFVGQSMESIMDMVDVSIRMAVFMRENGSPEPSADVVH